MRLICFFLLFSTAHASVKQFDLVDVAFDRDRHLSQRWRSLVALSITEGHKSIKHLDSALSSNEWFMRDAGLFAISGVDTELALEWARKLITDKALIVRTTALKVIRNHGSKADIPILLEALSSKQNFKGNHSLWD